MDNTPTTRAGANTSPSSNVTATKHRFLVKVVGVYFATLIVVGLLVAYATGSALLGAVGVVIAIAVLPFIATGLRIGYQRRRRASRA